jgi:hypothetical protein
MSRIKLVTPKRLPSRKPNEFWADADGNAVALTGLLFDTDHRLVHTATFAQAPPVCRDHVTRTWREITCPRQGFFGQRRISACKATTVPLAVGLPLVRRVFSRVRFSAHDQRGSEIVLEKTL